MHLGGSAPLFSVIQIPNTGTLWQDIEDFLPNIESPPYWSVSNLEEEVIYNLWEGGTLWSLLSTGALFPPKTEHSNS